MKRSIISLEFNHLDAAYSISGLQLINIEANNFFWHSKNLSASASYANNSKSYMMLELKGLFLNNYEQLLMQDLAFNGKNFSGAVKHEFFKITGDFDIQRYQLSNDIDELDFFDLQLVCRNHLAHHII